MNLDDRKKLILQAIVEDYINTAEPVGSRSIAKKSDLNISAATIRNEMGDLEDMGLLLQPHTSAGRIPSNLGYRLYVDSLMKKYEMTANEINQLKNMMYSKIKELDSIVRHVTSAFSSISNFPTIGALPTFDYGIIKSIKLVAVDPRTIMIIIADGSGLIKNKLLRLREDISEEFIEKLNMILNQNLTGLTLTSINLNNIIEVQNAVDGNLEILSSVLELVHEAISEIDSKEVFMEGTTNILSFPEYKDIEKIKEIFELFEDKEYLGSIIEKIPADREVKVIIGDETSCPQLKNNSIILAKYDITDNVVGVVGVIGPMRMNYSKLISNLEFFSKQLSETLMRSFGQNIIEENNKGKEGDG